MHDGPQEPIRENDTLSEFVLQMIVLETAWFAEPHGTVAASEGASSVLYQHFQPLGLPDWHWPGQPTRLYGRDDVLIELFGDERRPEIRVATLSEASLKEAVGLFKQDC